MCLRTAAGFSACNNGDTIPAPGILKVNYALRTLRRHKQQRQDQQIRQFLHHQRVEDLPFGFAGNAEQLEIWCAFSLVKGRNWARWVYLLTQMIAAGYLWAATSRSGSFCITSEWKISRLDSPGMLNNSGYP
jgi:hypothetical protein